jgi:enterobactin synthetase component D
MPRSQRPLRLPENAHLSASPEEAPFSVPPTQEEDGAGDGPQWEGGQALGAPGEEDPASPTAEPERAGPKRPWEVVLRDAVPHGILVGVSMPGDPKEIPPRIWERLHPGEQLAGAEHRGYRRLDWLGGRLAAREALEGLGLSRGPVLTGSRGVPQGPPGVSISIAHKRGLAVALVARRELGSLGVDLEELGRPRPGIARMVLTPTEQEVVNRLPEERRWIAILLRFSIKEAIYKALAPRLERYIDFDEAEVLPRLDGTAAVGLRLKEGPSPDEIEARYLWLDEHVLCTTRVRWSTSSQSEASRSS